MTTPDKEAAEKRLRVRYVQWSKLRIEDFALESSYIQARSEAWHFYCDARDGLEDGTSKRKYLGLAEVKIVSKGD